MASEITLESLWEQQAQYNQKVKEIQQRSQVEWTETYLLGLVSEIGELLQECNWKKHRLHSSEEFGPNVPEELADLTKFIFSLWNNLGYGPDEMLQSCWQKGIALEQKFQQEHRPRLANKRVLLLDLDGCIADFRTGFERWVERHPQFRESLPSMRREEGFTLHMDIDSNWPFSEYTKAKLEFEKGGGYATLPAYDELLKSIYHLQRMGWYVIVWTARPGKQLKRVWRDTWEWLLKSGLQPDEFHFGGDERISDAVRLVGAGNHVLAIEDNPDLASRYVSNRIPVILVSQPYNRAFEGQGIFPLNPHLKYYLFEVDKELRKAMGIGDGQVI